MIKRYTILLVIIIACFTCVVMQKAVAQQAPQYTQYFENRLAMNPAYAGIENRICLTALHRNQWAGMEGSPETNVATIHSNLNNPYVHGIGLHVMDDELGPINNLAFSLSASHSILLGPGELRMGLNVGGFQRSVGEEEWVTPDIPAGQDPTIPDSEGSDIVPDIGLGFYYHTQDWFAGLSSQHIHEPSFGDWGGADNKIFRVFYLTGGYNYMLSENVTLQPQSLIKFDRAKLQIDLTASAILAERFRIGATYRYEDAVAFHAGFRVIEQLRVGYSYDVTTSELRAHSDGSHEFMISYCFRIPVRDDRPIIIRTPRFL